jgi:hypothetical protein
MSRNLLLRAEENTAAPKSDTKHLVVSREIYDSLKGIVKSLPKRYLAKHFVPWTCSLLVVLLFVKSRLVHAQMNLQEYYDRDYGYVFNYPTSWKLQSMPEGSANKDIRLMLQGPNGTDFMVVVDKTKQTLTKTDFEDESDRTRQVGEMIQQTITQIYQVISESIKAVNMKVGERRDLSNDVGIKFYIATLNTMKTGKPIIIAGIHAFPFNKDYSINFTMTTFWDPAATQDHEMFTQVFNSFRLIGEPQTVSGSTKPPSDNKDSQ